MSDLKSALLNSGIVLTRETKALVQTYNAVKSVMKAEGHDTGTSEVAKGIFGVEVAYALERGNENVDEHQAVMWTNRANAKIKFIKTGGNPTEFRIKKRYNKTKKSNAPEKAAQTLWNTHHDSVLRSLLTNEDASAEKELLVAILAVYPDVK